MNQDVEVEILKELRMARRANQLGIAFCILLVLGFGCFLYWQHSHRTQQRAPQHESWEEVRAIFNSQQYDRALALARKLVEKHPNDDYGYAYYGNLLLAAGRVREAESNYLRAWELLPSEANEKMLQAIQKRRAADAAKETKSVAP